MKLCFKSLLSENSFEHCYPLESNEDFYDVVDEFPQLEECLYRNTDLHLVAKDMALCLSKHHIKAWIIED